MFHHHPSVMHHLVRTHQQNLLAAGERSRLRRAVPHDLPRTVHRPTTSGTR
jgi:hypothetical protein